MQLLRVSRRSRLNRLPPSLWLGLALLAGSNLVARSAQPAVDFDRVIRPILSENCYSCHGPDKNERKADLRLDMPEGAFARLDSGDAPFVPGDPSKSAVLHRVSLAPDDDDRMPPAETGKSLSPTQIDQLRLWIKQGAKWAEHWAYVPPQRPPLPKLRKKRWVRNEIDRFILDRLHQEDLKPNREADRYTLIRRASLDLLGLPPTLAEVDEFISDKSSDAYEKVVDRLLASPHFGERLALAWLDQARYADTAGYHFDGFRQMHLWRDWVINAFNDNMPFDQFTIEQLAGDMLPDATVDQKIATGFHRNVMTNDEGGADPKEYLTKYVADRVNTTAQVWLGTTMGCAECHDHKYDPISTREFYQFYAFFHNVPERGLDGTRKRNPAPVLQVPSRDQGAKLLRLMKLISEAEKTVARREGELPKLQTDWEKKLQENPPADPHIDDLSFLFLPVGKPKNPTGTNHAEIKGSANESPDSTFVSGKIGRALRLRGRTNEVLELGSAVQLEATNHFSFGAWIKPQEKTGAVFSKRSEAPALSGFELLLNGGKAEVHLVNEEPDNLIRVVTKDSLPTNAWRHLFFTYDGSRKAAGLKFYLDGKTRPVDTPKDALTASIATAAPLLLGGRTNAFPFNGEIADLRFYRRELSAQEVASLAAHANQLIASLPEEARTEEQTADLKRLFRENEATALHAAQEHLNGLNSQRGALMNQIPDTMVMRELDKPRDTFVLIRGDFQRKGEKVGPGTPGCWPALDPAQPTNRLSLARWLVATNNPLTARVIVNRYWAMLFGIGLVKTGNDFGSQGERPSHPELLDWLACEFMQGPRPQTPETITANQPESAAELSSHGWNVKHLLRLMVTSATYRQSAVVSKQQMARDPYNRLLSRGPRIHLLAELVRDNALAISGLLEPKIGGPSVKPYQPPRIWAGTNHKYVQSKGTDLYRRGMYVFWKRAAHYPSFATFDAPSRETCTLERPVTSTPLQSLVIMNDPVYVEAARALATRALREGGSELRDQVIYAFRLTLARPPEKKEIQILEHTYHQQLEHFGGQEKAGEALLSVGESSRPDDLDVSELAAMTGVANVLLNLHETIVR